MKKYVLFLILIFTITSVSFATGYLPEVGPELTGDEGFQEKAGTIVGSMKWIGYAIAIGMLIYVGIKYTISAADEKASMKGVLVKVVIGSLIIAGSTMIVDFVLSLSQNRKWLKLF